MSANTATFLLFHIVYEHFLHIFCVDLNIFFPRASGVYSAQHGFQLRQASAWFWTSSIQILLLIPMLLQIQLNSMWATATSVKTLSCLDRLLNSHRDSVQEHCKFRFLKHLCMNYSPRWWCADRYQSNNNWIYICSKRVTCDFSWCSKFYQYLNFL